MWVGTPRASPPMRSQMGFGLGAGVGLAAGDDHAGAGGEQPLGDGPSDAAGAAGDDGDPAGQVEQLAELGAVH